MKALVKAKAEPGLWLEEVPQPKPGPGEVLIRVLRTGICGTDLHIDAWNEWAQHTIKPGLIIGHEFVGEVVELGEDVASVYPGEIVGAEGHIVCGRCRNCMAGRRALCANSVGIGVQRDGAFAEYIVMPAGNLWPHLTKIDLDVASIFDPFGNAVHVATQYRLVAEDVLITGAGPIGLMAAIVARHNGARFTVVTDVSDYRLELARKMGVTEAVDVRTTRLHDAQQKLGMKEGFDVGFEMSHRGARPAGPRVPDRVVAGRIQDADDPRRLRSPDLRDLVPDVGVRAERSRHLARHHPPFSIHGVQGGLPRRPFGPVRKDRPGLERLMFERMRSHLTQQLQEIRDAGLEKPERVIGSPQGSTVAVMERDVLNLCANNYLGLADHPEVVAAAKEALDRWGYGMASVRFICGTQEVHKELEEALTEFLGTEDTILYSSCFDANGGIFAAMLDEGAAVISDALNHASIIDGIRLCKAKRFRYANRDMADLEKQLQDSGDARFRMVVTDGVFSMDGYMAPLPQICELADRYDAMVMVDDSHAVGFIGANGRGTPEHHGVLGRIDAITGTLGKALGGASGGYVAGRKELVAMLRQRSRPYLFSNSVAPPIAAASLKVLELLRSAKELRERLAENTRFFRSRMTEEGFDILPGDHPIVPVMIGDAALAGRTAAAMLDKGVYVIGFSYPVVPQGKARIRCQVSAAHSRDELERAVRAFVETRAEVSAAR